MITPVESGRCTARFLVHLPDGHVLVSDLVENPAESLSAVALKQRWQHDKAVWGGDANGGVFHIFPSTNAAGAHFAILQSAAYDPVRD